MRDDYDRMELDDRAADMAARTLKDLTSDDTPIGDDMNWSPDRGPIRTWRKRRPIGGMQ